MIFGAHFYRQMADLAEQLINPETIKNSGSLLLTKQAIKMTSHLGSLPEIQEPRDQLWKEDPSS